MSSLVKVIQFGSEPFQGGTETAALKRGSGCCGADDLLHSSFNLVFIQQKLDDIFIFGMAYSDEPVPGWIRSKWNRTALIK